MTTNTLPALNLPLLTNLITWAWYDAHADRDMLAEFFADWGSWNQDVWASVPKPEDDTLDPSDPMFGSMCGSSYCIAGQAVAQAGYKMVLSEGYGSYTATSAVPVVFDHLNDLGRPVYREVGEPEDVPVIAARVLGLTEGE